MDLKDFYLKLVEKSEEMKELKNREKEFHSEIFFLFNRFMPPLYSCPFKITTSNETEVPF